MIAILFPSVMFLFGMQFYFVSNAVFQMKSLHSSSFSGWPLLVFMVALVFFLCLSLKVYWLLVAIILGLLLTSMLCVKLSPFWIHTRNGNFCINRRSMIKASLAVSSILSVAVVLIDHMVR